METLKHPIIIALDTDEFEKSKRIIDQSIEHTNWYKVGMEAYYSHGEKLLDYLFFKGAHIFLDLKLHDIPTTVKKSLTALLKKYPVDIINIHALGGLEMMKTAKEVINENGFSTKIIAVTILTSHDDQSLNNELGINGHCSDTVKNLTSLALEANLDGVVCSAKEAKSVRANTSKDFLIVTPGIRFNARDDDQKRIATPRSAFKNGASHIVMGREITLNKNVKDIISTIKESVL